MHATRISLTDFVDFVARPGMNAKLNKVREIKHRGPYNTASDFYRPVREAVIRTHADGRDRWEIRGRLAHHELARLAALADAYIGWWGQRRLDWFEPDWQVIDLQRAHHLTISVNPELGLHIDGRPHLVKLYFKEDPLSPQLADVAARLMARVLGGPRDAAMAILDVRRRRLLRLNPRPDLDALLDAEVAAFGALWAQA